MTEISNVGQLRKALEGLPDDRPILAQVVATNGQAWNLMCEFTADPPFLKWASVMTMKHRELTSLQWPAQETAPEHPNAAFRWICVHCETVNGKDITSCVGCKRDRYPSLNRSPEHG